MFDDNARFIAYENVDNLYQILVESSNNNKIIYFCNLIPNSKNNNIEKLVLSENYIKDSINYYKYFKFISLDTLFINFKEENIYTNYGYLNSATIRF